MFEEKGETIMARWLAGELSDEEQQEFEASELYAEYLRLQEGLEAFQKPDYDREALRSKVWDAIEKEEEPAAQLRTLPAWVWMAGTAASIIFIYSLFFSKITYRAEPGVKELIALPDGSQVHLNANSVLKRKRFFWNREVSLIGEALFLVEKGEGFKVETAKGHVSVLGTQFNVRSKGSEMQVYCYEGKVQYNYPELEQSAYLVAGDAVELLGDVLLEFKHSDERPDWIQGKSRFENTPLEVVIRELEDQFGVEIQAPQERNSSGYTGTFYHNDLKLALQAVFYPMGYTFEISEDGQTILLTAL